MSNFVCQIFYLKRNTHNLVLSAAFFGSGTSIILLMGICLVQYRNVVGSFNGSRSMSVSGQSGRCGVSGRFVDLFSFSPFGIILYTIFLVYFLVCSLGILLSSPVLWSCVINVNFTASAKSVVEVHSSLSFLNCKYVIILSQTLSYNLPYVTSRKKFLKSLRKYLYTGSIYKIISDVISVGLISLNLILIVISNLSLLNPGPSDRNKSTGLSVHYHNVQGFIGYSSLGNPHPSLNMTKVLEFQSHIDITRPDVIILNETWLKPSISNQEILPFSDYKVFRLDRSDISHPPDPLNPSKYKRNGGGVLIAVKSSLNLKPALLKSHCNAEMLSVTVSLPNRKKACISTCYSRGVC